MEGWISVHRKIRESWIWNSDEVYDKRSAWLDLLLAANYQDKEIQYNKQRINIEKGQFLTSIAKLADRWKWSRHKVSLFLDKLEEEKMIVQIKDNKSTLISIENYEKYQEKLGQKRDTKRTAERTCVGTSKNDIESVENKGLQEMKNQEADMFVNMSRDKIGTKKGHKQ